jgi:hypothetical protein
MDNYNATPMPRGIQPGAGSMTKPMSEEDWVKRMERMQELGVDDDSLLMRGTEFRRGLAERREQFRDDARDSIRQALGFKAKDSAALGAAAKGAGKSSLMSSL